MSNKLMTALWEASDTKGTDLFVLIALADNANDEGQCWPSIKTIAHKVRSNERTVQRILRKLETAGHLRIETSEGGRRSNRYLVHYPQNWAQKTTRGITPPVADNVTPPPAQLCRPTPGTAMSPEPSENPKTEPSVVPIAKDELGVEGIRFVAWFMEQQTEAGLIPPRTTPAILANWADCYVKLRRIDGREKEEIKAIVRWIVCDPFWRTNCQSPMKLRQRNKDGVLYYDYFLAKMNQPVTSNGRRAYFA